MAVHNEAWRRRGNISRQKSPRIGTREAFQAVAVKEALAWQIEAAMKIIGDGMVDEAPALTLVVENAAWLLPD